MVTLSRTGLVMEVYTQDSVIQLSEVLHDLEIRAANEVIYRGRAIVTALVNTGLMLIVSVRLMDDWAGAANMVGSPRQLCEDVETFVAEWTQGPGIRPDYQLAVARIQAFLSELSSRMERSRIQQPDTEGAVGDPPEGEADEALMERLCASVLPPLNAMFHDFEAAAANVGEDERGAHVRYVQRQLHPLLLSAPFVHRAYTKPLGYAGDYEMVNMMLRPPYEGATTYARIVNALHLQTSPAQAHRNRIDVLEDWLAEAAIAAEHQGRRAVGLNVGCGPAIEVQRLVRNCSSAWTCDLTLLDFSEETLRFAQAQLTHALAQSKVLAGLRPRFRFVQESVHRMIRSGRNATPLGRQTYDFIYCAGLFDYLSDKACSSLLKLFYQWLRPGGRILVTNVTPRNTALYLMEHILEWHLIYRDEGQMRALVPDEWIRDLYCDATGVNVFLELQKHTRDE